MQWVIDTNVLVVLNTPTSPKSLECWAFLSQLWLGPDIVVLDVETEILDEYNCYATYGTFAYTWLNEILARNKVVFYSSKLPNRVKQGLDDLRFDLKDRKFVAVALRTSDDPHCIVNAVDSDWTPEVCKWLFENNRILVLSTDPTVLAGVAAAG